MHNICRYTKHRHSKQNHWHVVTTAHTNMYIQPEGGGSEGGAAKWYQMCAFCATHTHTHTHTHVLLTQTETVHSWLWSMLQSLSYLLLSFLVHPHKGTNVKFFFTDVLIFQNTTYNQGHISWNTRQGKTLWRSSIPYKFPCLLLRTVCSRPITERART